MSKISKAVKVQQETKLHRKDETVVNFMGGESFTINPLDTMKMVTASSIFGEASYYRDGKIGNRVKDAYYKLNPLVTGFTLLDSSYNNKTTTEIMESVIDDALTYDFKGEHFMFPLDEKFMKFVDRFGVKETSKKEEYYSGNLGNVKTPSPMEKFKARMDKFKKMSGSTPSEREPE